MRTSILLALVLAACSRAPEAAPASTTVDPRTIDSAASTATNAPAIEPTSFGAELPPRARVIEITRRAHDELRVHDGFLNALDEVQQCYRSLRHHPEIESRVYCLQLDETACGNEIMTDYSFRRADERHSDYLTEEHCEGRQEVYAPPLGRDPNTQARRAQVRRDLEAANEQIEEQDRRASR